MLLIESLVALNTIAAGLSTKVIQEPHGISIHGTDATGNGVHLRVNRVNCATDVCEVTIVDSKSRALSAVLLVGGRVDLQPDGVVTITDVKPDRLRIGPGLAAVIEHGLRIPQP